MGSRSLTNVVTQNSIALNAYIYGYAGHSLVTPHAPLQQIWWTQERIDAKVTPEFITSRLRKDEREMLRKPLAFGDGLTDDTYLEWILERARRLFLILAEIGVPDQIFGVIDDSWDDEDLPISLDTVERLALSYRNDEQLNRKFHHTQFTFLLRELHRGAHIAYGPNEVVPLEHVYKLPPAASLQHWSRVHLPKKPDEPFVRRRISVGSEGDDASEQVFLKDVAAAQEIEHAHIAPVWASYTAKGSGFFITSFVGQHTLKTFIDHRSAPQYMKLPKPERRALLLDWMHCLSDTVATLHGHGVVHGAIRPTNILVDADNVIAFSDIGTLKSLQRDKKTTPEEIYIYAAPEAHGSTLATLLSPPTSPSKAKSRRSSVDSEASHGSHSSTKTKKRVMAHMSSPSLPSFDFGLAKPIEREDGVAASEPADVFSLGCIFLDILTFMLKKKPADFVKHRSTKHKTGGRGSSRVDSSFHANPQKLETWMKILEDLAFEQDDCRFRAVKPLLQLVRDMTQQSPDERPSAFSVAGRLRDMLTGAARMAHLHCDVRTIKTEHVRQAPGAGLRTIPEDGLDEESIADAYAVADSATLRHSIADSTASDATAVGSLRTLNPRPKSIQSTMPENLVRNAT